MEENQQSAYSPCRQTPIPDPGSLPPFLMKDPERAMNVSAQDSFDSMLCDTGARLVLSGLKDTDCRDDIVMFVNAGGCPTQGRAPCVNFEGDSCFQGGDVIRTDEPIIEGGDYPSMYQSARFGNFCYKFDGLSAGDYFVDLHFAEIVNTNGPKGIRIFDIYIQDEQIVSELDIYAVVGANKPLQLIDVRVSVAGNGSILIKFEGKRGTPVVCGISIRKAPEFSAPLETSEHLTCEKCATELQVSPIQNRARRMKFIAKYEKKIQDLTDQFKLKSDECYEAWMSLTAANEQMDKMRMEYDNKMFLADTLTRDIEKQTEEVRILSESYQRDKMIWAAAIKDLEGKLKALKGDHSRLSQEAHECAHSIPDLNKMIVSVQTLVAQCEDLKMKYYEELAKRKKLYNQVQEIKGNIRVFCRCRPLSREELMSGHGTVVDFEAAKDGDLGVMNPGSTKKIFKFDRVYSPKDNQADVYADASPFVTSVLDGYNVCIFAYGQTGTGKTFTMEGREGDRGVNYRTLEELFKIAWERRETFTYSISVSVLEIYNEQIRDLLATSPSSKKLEVRQAAEGLHHVPGIVEANVENIKEVWDVLQAGSNARAVGSNNVNEHSSRSHCMLCIMVSSKNLMNGECTKSKLWLIDLAGSERLAKTDVQGERLKEAQNINRSLSALGDVISALSNKSSHVPYRNSKLTHLLQDSLGGDSKALMFVQISPSGNDVGETLSSLNFASRVRGIELGPARKHVDTGELQRLKQMVDKVRQEGRTKDESLRNLEENCQNLENKVKGKEQLCRNLQEKNKELEGQLESKTELLQQKVKELEYKLKEQQHSELMMLQQKVKELECKLKEQACAGSVAEQKVKELEFKLRERRQSESMLEQKVQELDYRLKEQAHFESAAEEKAKELEFKLKERRQSESMLEQKVKELEDKLREEREDQEPMLLMNSTDTSRIASQAKRKTISKDETMSDTDPQILGNSNSLNRMVTGHQGSILLKGTETLHEIKRKRELRSAMCGEHENVVFVPTSVVEKIPHSEVHRQRKIDQAKAFGRLTRTPKVVTTQKLIPHSRANKDLVTGGIKERERSRGWL